MFAFAIWEARTRRLTLARDRAGIKPLYYAELADGGIVFASELSALLAHGGVDRELSTEGLASYFFSDYVHPPATIVREGAQAAARPHRHLAGRQLRRCLMRTGRCRRPRPRPRSPTPSWRPSCGPTSNRAVDGPAGLRRAGRHLPVGRHRFVLRRHGGRRRGRAHEGVLDRVRERDLRRDPLRAHGGRAAGRRVDLRDAARTQPARRAWTRRSTTSTSRWPTRRSCRPSCCRGWRPATSRSSSAATAATSCGAATRPTARTGCATVYGRVPGWIRQHVVERAWSAGCPSTIATRAWSGSCAGSRSRWDDDMVTRHLRWMSSVDLPDLARAIPAAEGMQPATFAAPLPETDDSLQRILALDFSTYMPGSVLTKVDRASMAHGLEVRPPLLDDAMVDRAFALPSRYKLRRGSGKYLLKLAARGKIPDEIIDRPKKGFGIPLASWLRGPLRDRIERGGRALAGLRSGHPRPRRLRGLERRPPGQAAPITASRCGRCSCWITGSAVTRIPDPHPRAWPLTKIKRQHRAPPIVSVTSGRRIRRSCPNRAASWNAGSDRRTLASFARQERDGRRLRHGPQPVLVRRGRRDIGAGRRHGRRQPGRRAQEPGDVRRTRGSRRPRRTSWIRRSTAPSIASPASACCTTWPSPRAR